jgi:hypothetical protein
VLVESKVLAIGIAILAFWLVVSLLAPWLAPFGPTENIAPMAPPGHRLADGRVMWLGADHLGRDVLSRILFGGRAVLFYAPLATLAPTRSASRSGWSRATSADGSTSCCRAPPTWCSPSRARPLHRHPAALRRLRVQHRAGGDPDQRPGDHAPGARHGARPPPRAYVAAAEMRGEPTLDILFLEILPTRAGR